MRNKIKKIVTVAIPVLFLIALLAPVAVVQAQAVPAAPGVTGFEVEAAGASGLSDRNFYEIISSVIFWLMTIMSVLAIIMFVIAGIMYLTAAGNEEQIEKAKKIITYAIIGIVVALVGLIIIQLIDTLVVQDATSF